MDEWWRDYPWRLIQTNLRQIDMQDMDAERYVQDLKSFEATVILFNAAGIIANYPTDLEDEPVNGFLQGDGAALILEKCHKAGIRVIARTDFSKVRRPVYERHPDWAFRDAEGKVVDYNGDVQVCPNGPYQQDYMFTVIRDMFERLPFDGIFYNMGGFQTRDYSYVYHGLCHCEHCRRKFRERFGLELPRGEDRGDPVYRKHLVFQRDCAADLDRRLYAHVRAIGLHIAVNNYDYQRIESNTEIGRPLPLWQYSASSNTRNSHQPGTSIRVTNTSVDFLGFPYRHVAVSPWLQELRLWQNIANRGNPDYYLIGRLDNHEDKSGFEHIKKVFRFAKEQEEELRGLESGARALVIHKTHWDDDPEARGWIRALSEGHIPLDEAQLEHIVSPESLARYRTVILPDMKYLSDSQAGIFDEFARGGGTVLATGETGFYDGDFENRPAPAFRCLGIEEVYFHRKDMLSAMLRLESEEDRRQFPRFKDTACIALGEEFIFTSPREGAQRFLRLVPPQPFGPPERCYSSGEGGPPGFSVTEYGKGRGIYLPWRPGAFFYREGYSNTGWFMGDLLEGLCGLEGIAPGLSPMVESALAFRPGRVVIQLVNLSGHYGNSYYEPLEIRDIRLRVPLEGRPLLRARALWSGEALTFHPEGSFTELLLPRLKDYEAVVLEFSGAAERFLP
jgi:hypothetical protein